MTDERANQRQLRPLVRGAYDQQKLRIQTGLRIVANVKAKLGQEPGMKEELMDTEGKQLLKDMRAHFKNITEGVTTLSRVTDYKGSELISEFTELALMAQYVELERIEIQHFKMIAKALEDYPIYTEFLADVRGIGPAMAGVIISEIDISKAPYPSSLHRYAGLDVGPDGRGRSRRSEHLVEQTYIDKNGKEATKMGLTYRPFLKSKLMGVLAPSFLRAKNQQYYPIYEGYKHRLESHSVYKDTTKKHRDNMARRYMVKQFLIDLHREWRALEGLSVTVPYHEAKLGIFHRKEAG